MPTGHDPYEPPAGDGDRRHDRATGPPPAPAAAGRRSRRGRAVLLLAAIAGTALIAFGGYRLLQLQRHVALLEEVVAAAEETARAARDRAERAERDALQAQQEAARARADAARAGSEASSAAEAARLAGEQRRRAEQERADALAQQQQARAQLVEARQAEAEAARRAEAARQEAEQARQEAERIRRERDAELARLQQALGEIADTRRTALGLVMNLGEDAITFAFDSADLQPEDRELLARIAGVLLTAEGYRIQIFGHTDDVGSDEYNLRLSERRAEAVRDYLVQAGLDPAIITTRGFGKSKPLVAGSSPEARARNRRVELGIIDSNVRFTRERDQSRR